MKFFLFIVYLSVASLFLQLPAFAASRYDILYMRPNPAGGAHFSVLDAKTLKQWRSTFGTSAGYSYGAFDLKAGTVEQFSVVDHLFVQYFYGAVGLTDWLEAGFDMPVVWYERFKNPDIAAPSASRITNAGDLKIQLKGRLLDYENFGLAMAGFIQPQTGKASTFLGNENFSGGALLAMDVKASDRFIGSLNAGATFRNHVIYRNVDFQHLFNLGAAADIRIYKGLHIQSEMRNSTPLDNPWKNKATAVLEADGGLAWHVGDSGFTVRGLAGGGFYHGLGSPTVRGTLAVSYLVPEEKKLTLTQPSPIPSTLRQDSGHASLGTGKGEGVKKNLAGNAVHFAFDSTKITKTESAEFDEIVAFLKAHPEIKKLRLEGHADLTGTEQVNMAISIARANRVKDYLIKHGVSGVKFAVVGFGESRPKAPNKTRKGRAQNRRVEFVVE